MTGPLRRKRQHLKSLKTFSGLKDPRCRDPLASKEGTIQRPYELLPGSQGHDLALTVLHVPYSLSTAVRPGGKNASAYYDPPAPLSPSPLLLSSLDMRDPKGDMHNVRSREHLGYIWSVQTYFEDWGQPHFDRLCPSV